MAGQSTLAARSYHSRDGFGTVRLVAAYCVIAFHGMPLVGAESGWSWGDPWYHYGTLTVAAFMAMSGTFVMRAWESRPRLGEFWLRRALRILPGLIVVLALSAFALGPLVTTLPSSDYYSHPSTWTYLVRNVLLFPQQYQLPGAFMENPYGPAVNGSLWCLPVEVLGYLMVTIVGLLGIASRRYLIFAVAGAFAALLVLNVNSVIQLPQTTLMLLTNPLLQYMSIYAMGIAAWLYRDRIPLSWWGVAACVVIEVISYQSPVGAITRAVTVPYAVVTVGAKLPKSLCLPSWLTATSFGVFIYGFPVEQTLVYLGISQTWQVITLGLAISTIFGLLSWHLVEKHGLRLRTALMRNSAHKRPAREDQGIDSEAPTLEFPLPRGELRASGWPAPGPGYSSTVKRVSTDSSGQVQEERMGSNRHGC